MREPKHLIGKCGASDERVLLLMLSFRIKRSGIHAFTQRELFRQGVLIVATLASPSTDLLRNAEDQAVKIVVHDATGAAIPDSRA